MTRGTVLVRSNGQAETSIMENLKTMKKMGKVKCDGQMIILILANGTKASDMDWAHLKKKMEK